MSYTELSTPYFYGPNIQLRHGYSHYPGFEQDMLLMNLNMDYDVTDDYEGTSALALMEYLEAKNMIEIPRTSGASKLSFRYKIFFHGLPDIDIETGYFSSNKDAASSAFKGSSSRRILAYVDGEYDDGERDFFNSDHVIPVINADAGIMDSVKECFNSDYRASHWKTYFYFAQSYAARPSSGDEIVEVLQSSNFKRVRDPNDCYLYNDTSTSIGEWEIDDDMSSSQLTTKTYPNVLPQDYDPDEDSGLHAMKIQYTVNSAWKDDVKFRFGTDFEPVTALEPGDPGHRIKTQDRRDTFVNTIFSELRALVASSAEIPREYRVRMQHSPSFDTQKLTTLHTAAPGTVTTPAASTGPTSPSGGSY